MVYAITAKLADAKRVIDVLQSDSLLDKEFQFKKTKTTISFPVIAPIAIGETINGATCKEVADDFFTKTARSLTLKQALKSILTAEQLEKLKTAYDTVGTIAILEIDNELREKEKEIANALILTNANIKTVLRKDGAHQGQYRTQPMKFLAGVDTRETMHVESGVRMLVDVEQVYFSPRLSTERLRIANLVKAAENSKNTMDTRENIMVFFSGAAPYCAVIGKKTQAKSIVGIEINPIAHKYAQETIHANKLKNVHLFCGDVHKVLPLLLDHKHLAQDIPRTYDRIIMNLPKSAHEYLDDALSISKRGTIIHYYDFLHEDEFDTAIQRIDAACKKHELKYKVLGIYTCGAQGIRTYRICVDVEIL